MNNHPVQFEHCDGGLGRPENLPQCLRKFAGETDLVALVGSQYDKGFDTALPNIVNIGTVSTSPEDLTAANAFPISPYTQSGALDFIASVRANPSSAGGGKPGVIYVDIPSSPVKALTSYFGTQNQSLATIPLALTAADYAPAVATAKSDQADPLLISHSTTAMVKILQQVKQLNFATHPAIVYACYDATLLSTLGSAGDGVSCSSPFKPWDYNGAGDDLKALMDKYGPKDWHFSYAAVNAYVADKVLVQALKGIQGDATSSGLLAAMKAVTSFSDPFLAVPIDFSKPGPNAKFPAVRDAHYYTYLIQGGKLTLPNPAGADMMTYLPTS